MERKRFTNGLKTGKIWIKGNGSVIREEAAMNLGEMKRIKAEKGYTNEQIAQGAEIPLGTVQKIFGGETKAPRYQTLQALEQFFLKKERGSFPDRVTEAISYDASKKQGEYTTEDYYALPEDRRVELIDGVFYDMSSPSFVHQRIVLEIFSQIKSYIDARNGACVVLTAPLDVRLDCDNKTIVQPDVIILCDKKKIMRWGIMGAPDFLAEVLSPSTKRKDAVKKLSKYIAAGVREYWMIDPDKRKLVIYRIEADELPEVYGLTGKAQIGIFEELWIDLDRIGELVQDYPDGGTVF